MPPPRPVLSRLAALLILVASDVSMHVVAVLDATDAAEQSTIYRASSCSTTNASVLASDAWRSVGSPEQQDRDAALHQFVRDQVP